MKKAVLFATLMASLAAAAPGSAGPEACARCHAAQATQPDTAMAHTLVRAENCSVLEKNPRLTFEKDGYSYEIAREGERSTYTVRKGAESFSVPLVWGFGQGKTAGQTYMFQWNGGWYDTRVSFYPAIQGLDVTMGFETVRPRNVEQAAGRRLDSKLLMGCFDCHATDVIRESKLDLDHLKPGILCDKCHGPSTAHLEAVRTGSTANLAMEKLGRLSAEKMSNFCGRCHGDVAGVAANGQRGTATVKFQPYRLAESRCYNEADRRIGCVACHDPHRELEMRPAAYDSKCEACHQAGGMKICKVGTHDCVTCHMPKVEPPGTHHRFTDHQIRIAKASDPYPE